MGEREVWFRRGWPVHWKGVAMIATTWVGIAVPAIAVDHGVDMSIAFISYSAVACAALAYALNRHGSI